MIDKVKKFFEMEYNEARDACDYEYAKPEMIVNYTIQRCLGVALFVQTATDVSLDEIREVYTKYRKKLERLKNDD